MRLNKLKRRESKKEVCTRNENRDYNYRDLKHNEKTKNNLPPQKTENLAYYN